MDAKTCLKKLEYVGVLAFATVDKFGAPQIRNISAIHYEHDDPKSGAMYFFTAKGKAFCDELLTDGRVQVLGYTKFKEMIRLSAKAVPVPEEDQRKFIDIIFEEQPYLSNVYPGDTRYLAGIMFQITSAEIEYFNLGVNPIFRENYTIGKGKEITFKGYHITDECIACGECLKNCPQRCIEPGEKFKIQQNHCLHCGNCKTVCPANAVEKV